jgi:hypothetical protein
MTTKVNLPNGQQGVIGSPAHRVLQRMARMSSGYWPTGRGFSVTQAASLAKGCHVNLHHEYEGRRQIIVGATITASGLRYVEMLDAAEREAQRFNELIGAR